MKKFSKLNENISIDKSSVNTLLSKIENISYQIFDYYTLKRKILSVRFKDDNMIEKVLSSLCSQLSSKEGFTWMKDIEVDVELENTKDIINELGFNIEFSGQSSSRDGLIYNFTIVEI